MRRLRQGVVIAATLLVSGTSSAMSTPHGHADVLQCPYPATGFLARVFPLVGEAIGYICNYPTERNLSHLHSEYGGYTTAGSTGGNAAIPGLQGGNAGVQLGIGLILWSQSYRCPDERYMAAPPNGYGAWKDPLDFTGVKCPAVGRAPLALDAPWPPIDPNIVVVVNQILPPGQPDPTAAPPADAPPSPLIPPMPLLVPPPTASPLVPAEPSNPIADGTVNLAPVPVDPVPLQPRGQ